MEERIKGLSVSHRTYPDRIAKKEFSKRYGTTKDIPGVERQLIRNLFVDKMFKICLITDIFGV